MDENREKAYLYWLMGLPELGAITIVRLYERFGSMEQIYNMEDKELAASGLLKPKQLFHLSEGRKEFPRRLEEYGRLKERGIRMVACWEEEYPRRLLTVSGYPAALFFKGQLPAEDRPSLAIVGARGCSAYGEQLAEEFARALAGEGGVQIVSGLAAGIDSAAHRGALRGGGSTFGVLGCGVDICYPSSSYLLYEAMVKNHKDKKSGKSTEGKKETGEEVRKRERKKSEKKLEMRTVGESDRCSGGDRETGVARETSEDEEAARDREGECPCGVLSEFLPGTQPLPQHFPMRNRIISGLCDGILVVEARARSGSLITAELALEQGRDVFALPGRVTDYLSAGCNRLIQQGAYMAISPSDIIEILGIKCQKELILHEKNINSLAKTEKMVYSCLDFTPKHLDEIAGACGLTVSECLGVLLELELGGYAFRSAGHYYGKKSQ